ncbi:MAG: 3-phosphoshikimate 1-carboxyvinyltransferase [Acidimicrobiia bacterium]
MTPLTIGGASALRGRLRVPGDKGISQRALVFAAMARGHSTVRGLGRGNDVRSAAAVLRGLGAAIVEHEDHTSIESSGIEGFHEPEGVLDCGNSGASIRFATGLLAGRPFLSVLTGDESLRSRPMRRVVVPLRAMGATIDGRDDGEYAPLVVRGGALRGVVHTPEVPSAQVKTALVLAGLQADGVTEIQQPAESRDHTERMLMALGASVEVDGLVVRVRRSEPAPFELDVPGDPSSAAFWCVAAAITPGSDLVVEGVALNPTRLGFVEVLRRMGAAIEVTVTREQLGEPVGDLRVVASALVGTTISESEMANVQDEIPVIAVAAAFANGVTEITGAAELRVKESDRIATVIAVLDGLGIGVEEVGDGMVIRGGAPRAGHFDSHGDHRIAMAAAVAAHAIDAPSTIDGWDAAAVTYPEFLDHLTALTGGRP